MWRRRQELRLLVPFLWHVATARAAGDLRYILGEAGENCSDACWMTGGYCDDQQQQNTLFNVTNVTAMEVFSEAGVSCDGYTACLMTTICSEWGSPFRHKDRLSCFFGGASAPCDSKPILGDHQRLCACKGIATTTTTSPCAPLADTTPPALPYQLPPPFDVVFGRVSYLKQRSAPSSWETWSVLEANGSDDGSTSLLSSEHFVVHGPDSQIGTVYEILFEMEQAWDILCNSSSDGFFVVPYTTAYWTDIGEGRKINFILGASQGCSGGNYTPVYVESDVDAVRDARQNPTGTVRNSYVCMGEYDFFTAARELTHALQIHTGGYMESDKNSYSVGWQWDAHAQYGGFLATGHMPPFVRTQYGTPADFIPDDPHGMWHFFMYLDKLFGAGFVNLMWHKDFSQRAFSEVSYPMVYNLDEILQQIAGLDLNDVFVQYGIASATLDLMPADNPSYARFVEEQDGAVLAEERFTELVESDRCHTWIPDPSSEPLFRLGFRLHRLSLPADHIASVSIASAGGGSENCGNSSAYGNGSESYGNGSERYGNSSENCGDSNEHFALTVVRYSSQRVQQSTPNVTTYGPHRTDRGSFSLEFPVLPDFHYLVVVTALLEGPYAPVERAADAKNVSYSLIVQHRTTTTTTTTTALAVMVDFSSLVRPNLLLFGGFMLS